ncbi:MAG: hypothetical protein OHK93_006577 [Ramalina farinacea]|uniref:Cwf18 pre-mRNA splicing factor n=1 Tax=Ramalina farinacea TaxID=258253 RepID=A0AA43TT82_9LECA|nr:hypothetical protein [Ramalina farinacea]
MASTHTSLDAAATERKARLARLASLKRKQPPNQEEENPPDSIEPQSSVSQESNNHLQVGGRNYDPETRGPKLGFETAPNEGQDTLEDRATALANAAIIQEETNKKNEKPLDLFTLQPKKPNWDLKRDLARKMEVLDQRTDNAMARLVRERIEGEKKKGLGKANGTSAHTQEENLGIGGVDLVEGVKLREREEEDDERREREEEEA